MSFDKLLNESPIDEANRHQDEHHLSQLVMEEVADSKTGVILTDKNYRTNRIREAAINGIKERLGRWAEFRNDILIKAGAKKNEAKNSEMDVKLKKLQEDREEQKSQARDKYMRRNDYADLKSDHELTKHRYETMRAEMGGKPPVKSKIFIYLISILAIGFIEWFINYSTFNMKYPSGIAFGATVLIALSIALASHFHGALLKQRVALFAKHRKKEDKRQIIIKQSFFSLLLIISLAIVTYNRYDLLMEQMVNTGGVMLPGDEVAEVSVWSELWPFVMMNVLVWVVGVAISYFTHDEQPDYQESLVHYNKAKHKFHKADAGLKEEENRIDEEFEAKLRALKNSQASHVHSSKELDSYFERLNAKEQRLVSQAVTAINGMLEQHQMMLVTMLRQSGNESVKFGPDLISLDQYQNKNITVDAAYVREILAMETI